jgi:hypothetical protein
VKILSPFRDYYDHIAHMYGGGDPKIVYKRTSFPLDVCNLVTAYEVPLTPNIQPYHSKYQFKNLCVMGYRYMLVQSLIQGISDGPWLILSPKHHPELYRYLNIRRPRFLRDQDEYDLVKKYQGQTLSEGLIQLCKRLQSPVFSYRSPHYHTVELDRYVPNLGECGLASTYQPAQLYQDLAYFMGNTLRDSPDLAPPTELSDKERIVQHGFDLKQSFRHRKS